MSENYSDLLDGLTGDDVIGIYRDMVITRVFEEMVLSPHLSVLLLFVVFFAFFAKFLY